MDRIRPPASSQVRAGIRALSVRTLPVRSTAMDLTPITAPHVDLPREERLLWWRGCVLAGRVAGDPRGAVEHAQGELVRLRRKARGAEEVEVLDAWEALLDEPVAGVLAVLTAVDPDAHRLRALCPLTTWPTPAERRQTLLRWRVHDGGLPPA